MDWERVGELIRSQIMGEIKINEPLKNYTTWKIGGPADLLAIPRCKADILTILRYGAIQGIPIHILGNGSNVLISDQGVRGIVIKMAGGFTGISVDGLALKAEAGVLLPALAQKACQHGLSGLEYLSGIPGTVGGAVIMNAGAYGGSIGGLVDTVEVCDFTGQVKQLNQQNLEFNYRHSSLKDSSLIILGVELKLKPGNPLEIKSVMQDNLRKRQSNQPLNLPNAGSVFVNPPGHAAGQLIEKAGLKGLRRGGAQVSEKHANFIVNRGNASAADVLELISEVQKKVDLRFGVKLQTEIKLLGED